MIIRSEEEHAELISTIYQTISSPALWSSVIKQLCELTGTRKGILTLRENDTAEFLVPERYASSSLYYQFSEIEVASFITEFIDFDPWTRIENKNRSSNPYILSSFISDAELRRSRMWEWLEPQKINDTVTVEIGQTEKYWAAMNLYFDNHGFHREQELLDTLNYYLPHLKAAFRLGEEYSKSKQLAERSASTIEQIKVPAALIDLDGRIIHCNSLLKGLTSLVSEIENTRPTFQFQLTGFQKQFREQLAKLQKESVVAFELGNRTKSQSDNYRITLTAIGERESILGEPTQTVLITIISLRVLSPISIVNMAKAKRLSRRQTELAQHLCNGGDVTDFGKKAGIGKSGAFHHWRELKRKTGAEKPREIYIIAEKYL